MVAAIVPRDRRRETVRACPAGDRGPRRCAVVLREGLAWQEEEAVILAVPFSRCARPAMAGSGSPWPPRAKPSPLRSPSASGCCPTCTRRHRGCACAASRGSACSASMARGKARPESDIDLLIEIDPAASLGFLDPIDIQEELGTLLGRPVQFAFSSAMRPSRGSRTGSRKTGLGSTDGREGGTAPPREHPRGHRPDQKKAPPERGTSGVLGSRGATAESAVRFHDAPEAPQNL